MRTALLTPAVDLIRELNDVSLAVSKWLRAKTSSLESVLDAPRVARLLSIEAKFLDFVTPLENEAASSTVPGANLWLMYSRKDERDVQPTRRDTRRCRWWIDEDWGIPRRASYSNTISGQANGRFAYYTADAVTRGSTYKVGGFVGWTYYGQKSDTTGCVQIGNPDLACLTPGDNRIVANQDTALECAPRRPSSINAETVVAASRSKECYPTFSPASFSVGVGGRRWAMWTKRGSDFICSGCGGPGIVSGPELGKYSIDRRGTFLQASYKFD
ncbi:hypothetical protein Q2941_30670 [Bradyrhizobium sp. UFLA05-153]